MDALARVVSADAALAWETGDVPHLRDLLAAVGFRAVEDDALVIPGLLIATRPSAGPDRLRAMAPDPAMPNARAESGADGSGARLRAIAVATIDLARAGAAFAGVVAELPGDALLGARVASTGTLRLVLAEPATEGRLAATLARNGEGPAALYVAVPPGRLGEIRMHLVRLGEGPRDGAGPFGPQTLAWVRRPWGPHLLLVADAPAVDRPAAGRSDTIRP